MKWNVSTVKPARCSVKLQADLCKWIVFEDVFEALLEIGLR